MAKITKIVTLEISCCNECPYRATSRNIRGKLRIPCTYGKGHFIDSKRFQLFNQIDPKCELPDKVETRAKKGEIALWNKQAHRVLKKYKALGPPEMTGIKFRGHYNYSEAHIEFSSRSQDMPIKGINYMINLYFRDRLGTWQQYELEIFFCNKKKAFKRARLIAAGLGLKIKDNTKNNKRC